MMEDYYFKLEIGSHFFRVINPKSSIYGLLFKFCYQYVLKSFVQERGKATLKVTKVFAGRTKDNYEFRFHIGQLDSFLDTIHNHHIKSDMYVIVYKDLYEPVTINVKLHDKWQLRDYQEQAVQFMIDQDVNDYRSRLLLLQTGLGKTAVALATITRLQTRTMIVILPTYIEQWINSIKNMYQHISDKDIMVVQGSNQLKGIIDYAAEGGLKAKFVILSIRTIQNFYKLYEDNRDMLDDEGYSCKPDELCQMLGIGTIIIDEVHQHIWAVYKFLTYTHVSKVLALSATLISDDPAITMMHRVMFPKEIRFDSVPLRKYIKVYAMSYVFKDMRASKIRTQEYGSKVYSHTAFEKSILFNPLTTKSYLELIDYIFNIAYLEQYQQGDKVAIYAATIAMCEVIVNYLKHKYRHLDIRRFVQDDPYENVIDADVRVTTVLSAGTGKDIPDLVSVIMLNSIKSSASNIQTLGRLRKIEGRDVKFYYVYCEQIPKQIEFHRFRKEIFRDRVASIKELVCPIRV